MPPKKKKTRRRRSRAISITGMTEAVMLANVGTMAIANTSAWDFFTAGTALNPGTKWTGQGSSVISLKELIQWPSSATGGSYAGDTRSQVLMKNLADNWLNAAWQAAIIPIGFKFGRRILRRPITMGNRLIAQAGLKGVIKI